jgi:ABC-2 type transport system ATP-binding protein
MFSYFRDWVPYPATDVRKAYVEQSSFSQSPTVRLYFNSGNELRKAKPSTGVTAQYVSSTAAPFSYSETSGLEGTNGFSAPPSDPPGTVASFTTPKLAHAVSLVGSSTLSLHLTSPTAAQTQGTDPGNKLVLFAKIYDVAPDGTLTLQNRLIAPVRVTDVTKPVNVQLPGVVQQFKAGHQIRITIASSDAAYGSNHLPHPVTISSTPGQPSVLRMPLHGPLQFG